MVFDGHWDTLFRGRSAGSRGRWQKRCNMQALLAKFMRALCESMGPNHGRSEDYSQDIFAEQAFHDRIMVGTTVRRTTVGYIELRSMRKST